MKYGLKLHSSDMGWITTSEVFDDDIEASIEGSVQVHESQAAYSRCIDAGLDVPFFDDYKVFAL
jgi:hypothetical protein